MDGLEIKFGEVGFNGYIHKNNSVFLGKMPEIRY